MTTQFDLSSPPFLQDVQQWFASLITRPIGADNRMSSQSPAGLPMEEEAGRYIAPGKKLSSQRRLELYNQQYWWRLLSVLHELFPMVVRLFGYSDFNQTVGFPYLVAYPPDHWSLNEIGAHLVKWVDTCYEKEDKALIRAAASIDWAYNRIFIAEELSPLKGDSIQDSLSSRRLHLQPFLELFDFDRNLLQFRADLLKESPEYWVDNPFPELEKKKQEYVLFRAEDNYVVWNEISTAEYLLLQRFKAGDSIDRACEWISEQEEGIVEEALTGIRDWFQEWGRRGWLSPAQHVYNAC